MQQDRRGEEITHPATDADRDDLLQVLMLRFGKVPTEINARIAAIQDGDRLDHLILSAANAPNWEEFLLDLSQPAFRMVGPRYDPLRGVQSPAAKGDRDI